MNIIKPKKLNINDTIGILALSGCIEEQNKIFKAQKYLESKGFKVVLSKNIFDKERYLAGSDEKKVEELQNFFSDTSINAILCARGGYGVIRLLEKIDFSLIKNNPKIFAGYSDVSALLTMIYKKTGLITFHSPMASGDFGDEKICEYTENSFFKTLTSTSPINIAPENNSFEYYSGVDEGILFGGNLASITSLCGMDFIPDENFIFFAEDLNEPAYKIDKMFTQLFNIEKFKQNIKGLVLGDFLNTEKEYFSEFIKELAQKHQIPTLDGFKITHAKEKLTLPTGAKAILDTNNKILHVESYLI